MPIERRDMITVFLKNKLVLMGGVGRYRQKLQSVDIYDIYTGNFNYAALIMHTMRVSLIYYKKYT